MIVLDHRWELYLSKIELIEFFPLATMVLTLEDLGALLEGVSEVVEPIQSNLPEGITLTVSLSMQKTTP